MTSLDGRNAFRVLKLPKLPISQDGSHKAASPFDVESLLDGFVFAPENRVAELAVNLVLHGVPVFDRPIGAAKLTAVASRERVPSRADVEILLDAARSDSPKYDSVFQRISSPIFNRDAFNAQRSDADEPSILDYVPFEQVGFLSPLVFYGPSGVGKSRLVEGICGRRRELKPHETIYRLSGSDFSNALLDAIRRDQTQLFRSLFGQANVVALENAELLALNESAQREFLPMLDAALKARKLIVLTFSQRPAEIRGFTADLLARVEAGTLVQVNKPTTETKRFVIQAVSQKLRIGLDDDALDACAQFAPSLIEPLCAAFVQAVRDLRAAKTELTPQNLTEFFQRRDPPQTLTLERITKVVSKELSVSIVAMRGKKRLRSLAFARQCVVFFARRLTDSTYAQIGAAFSRRNHATMIHAENELIEQIQSDPEVRRIVQRIAQALRVDDPTLDYVSKENVPT